MSEKIHGFSVEDLLEKYPADCHHFESTKSFWNYPCAHRQYRHDGNCHLVHGYSRSFHFRFGAKEMTKEGFVVDYGDLDELKKHLDQRYDHTLILDEGDPEMETFRKLEASGVHKIYTHPMGPGMEGTAHYLCMWADIYLRTKTKGRAWVISVEARENDKNSSIYINPNAGFKGWN